MANSGLQENGIQIVEEGKQIDKCSTGEGVEPNKIGVSVVFEEEVEGEGE